MLLLLLLGVVPPVAGGDPLPETDWFSTAGHGIFTHYLSGLQNSFGRNSQDRNSTWDECVNEFNATACGAAPPTPIPTHCRHACTNSSSGPRSPPDFGPQSRI